MTDPAINELSRSPGVSVRKQRQQKPKARRGTIPLEVFLPDDYAQMESLMAQREQAIANARRFLEEGKLDRLELAKQEQLRLLAELDNVAKRGRIAGEVPFKVVPAVHPAVLLATHLLVQKQTGSIKPALPTMMEKRQQLQTLRHFRCIFEVPIESAWILPYLDSIHAACLDGVNARYREANLDGAFLEAAGPCIPDGILERASWTLEQTRRAMSEWPVPLVLPAWVDGPLTAYLVGRFGFDNGGGLGGYLSRDAMTSLLASPRVLLKALTKTGRLATAFRVTISQLEALPVKQRKGRTAPPVK